MGEQDRRVVRTRAAVGKAVGELLLEGGEVRVAEIVDRADVGRSTFYDHFGSVDDAILHALAGPFGRLADAVAGNGSVEDVSGLMRHFWASRRIGRSLLWGSRGQQVSRLLTHLVETRLVASGASLVLSPRLVAAHLADGTLGLLRGWIAAEASASPDELAGAIIKVSQATLAALSREP